MKQIYFNGKIITMNAKNVNDEKRNEPEAVFVQDGVITQIGRLADLEKMAGDDIVMIDLKGKCLMPAFIDSHSHFVMTGQMSACADLSTCESFDDIVKKLKEYIINNSLDKHGAVLGFGYDHNFLKENSQPDRRVLDMVSVEIPIFILHISGHLGCANSVALKLANIDEHSTNPEGGFIGRIDNSNEPDGYLEESGMNKVQAAILPRLNFDMMSIMQKMQDIYIENGITTVQDGASTSSNFDILMKMSESGCLKLDVVSYPLMSSNGVELMKKYGDAYMDYKKHLKIGGYKLVLDGSPQGRSAWLSKPYLGDETEYCGYPWMQGETVYGYIKKALEENKQVLAHCNGDAASEQFLNAYKMAKRETKNDKDLRPVMIHCQTVRNDQLDRMAELKMIASIFVGHVWYWGDVHIKNLGEERGNHISPAKDALDRGVLINFHQDTPVTKPYMMHSVWCAVNRISRTGKLIGTDQAIDVYEALKAITINAAYEYFEETSKGSIAVGKKADFVILDKSPLEIDKMEIKNIKVLETIKEGEILTTGRIPQ
jgi:hypothetical protein